ncbi:MAG: type I restriction endonuclease subunit R [Candidatus Berkelbacteria bacterium]|nr:type I restriction endonuclease subunit R [Candidatus Berkelbacteria bacterium]
MKYTESTLEEATKEWFEELGYQTIYGPEIESEAEKAERKDFSQVVLEGRLKSAIEKLNPNIPADAVEEAFKKVVNVTNATSLLISNNQLFHKYLVNGIDVEYRRDDGTIAGDKVWLIDKENIDNNDWVWLDQFTVKENEILKQVQDDTRVRRPDVVIFVNGLPLAVFELKNLADENVGIKEAFNQFQTYKNDIPSLFAYSELLVISDGAEAKVGSITSDNDRFMRWRSVDGAELASDAVPQLETLIKGVFDKKRFLDIVCNFIVFNTFKTPLRQGYAGQASGVENIAKIVPAYHQYFATNKALESTIQATADDGDQRAGVVWHTQGSGKSLTMAFYAGKLIQALKNPTVVVLTDRNDLDDQLFDTFSKCSDLLKQTPVQAKNRRHLRELLKVASGGVVFTTIQKFLDKGFLEKMLLTDRRNAVVIADEAHRSQYDFIDGYARSMRESLPNASFIGFTGTPIELSDKNTKAVFGGYVDVYDISQAVADKATVPIFYEARLAKINLLESEKPKIDADFNDITEGEEVEMVEKLKNKWARLEAMVGSEKRIKQIAQDIVEHFENRLDVMDGKGMIVSMSRRIAVELYDEIIKLRPDWHNDSDKKGFIKVIMTGSASDPLPYQKHIRNKESLREMADRMKDPSDELKLVIVRDMWLTGFDVPSMHTMYIDKPMKGHGLMQAIARVNRVYKEKPGGLVVDYLGIAPQLKEALAEYSENDQENTAIDQEKAVSVMLEKFEVLRGIFHEFDYERYFKMKRSDKTKFFGDAMDFVLSIEPDNEESKKRFNKAVVELSKAFALAVPHEKALKIKDHVGFFQALKAYVRKISPVSGPTEEDYDLAIKQIVSDSIASGEIIDVFKAAGLGKPNVEILSDEFLEEVRGLGRKNVALEILKKLLNDEIRSIMRKNMVKGKSFAEMLEATLIKYQNRTIEAAQVIADLIELAKELRGEVKRGKETGLSDDEIAFYDALAENESAKLEIGDETLKKIAKELVVMMRENATIDWTLRDAIKARMRIYIKKLLKKYDYPPDKQEGATQLVLLQAETIGKDWGEK